MNLAHSERMDSQLNKWKKSLPMIQAVLADAGQKHVTQRAVEIWLRDLHDLAYDIDDVLDDLATEALKRELNPESHASTSSSKLLKIIPTCCTNFTPHNIMYGCQMSCKLDEITTKLNDLVERKILLGLDVNVNVKVGRSDRRLEETSLLQVDESKVLGREVDKEALLGKLLRDDDCKQNVSIVSIVGLGGIGKTTLARLVYNDEKVKDHFELRAWVCVSDEFDVFNISKAIYQAVNGENKEFANLDLLQVALKEKLSKKLFLVVLDDVWNEDHKQWDLLQSPFLVGAPGSKIVVTTRKTKVASVMNSFQPYDLEVLTPEMSLSLFAEYALNEQNFDKYPSLESIAQGIIQKCDGLPLALITLGRVLKTKGRSDDEWEKIVEVSGSIIYKACSFEIVSVTYNEISKVPPSIGSLKHLRYLNFSETMIKRVPEEVSGLYNLQSLLVRDCRRLTSLPVSFVKLINLRHLDMRNTHLLNKTPIGIGRLTSLRTLSKVYIEKTNGFKLSELKCLQDLQGELTINGLEKVKNPTQANDAVLQQTKGLDYLVMEWSAVFDV